MRDEKRDDLFGRLPNEIICHIISFLSLESALETSYISSRWRGLWNTSLVQHVAIDEVPDAISKFLSHIDKLNPLRHPRRLELHFGEGSDILIASTAQNNKLHLDFSTGKKEEYPLRQFDLQLQLKYNQNVQSLVAHHQPCSSTFYVKTLHIKAVTNVANEVLSSMFSSFQFLENLKIIECDGLQSVHIESSPKLLSLTILDCQHLESLHLRTSKLQSFHYRGFLPLIWPEHHFNLVDAMLDFKLGPSNTGFRSSDFDPLLLTIKNARVLTLRRWTFQTLIWPLIASLKQNFVFYKLEELWWIDNEEESYNTDALISFLKLSPVLERLFVTNDPESYCITSSTPTSKIVKSHTTLGCLKVIKMVELVNDLSTQQAHIQS
ncbi:F-box protein At2g39490 [Argentina anserina]|uniref:F-box protein At2g39490 n=1 Tax=Argentina anserina TaxID=57926 RepID=UPI0021765FF4|nr:F-box protein At2g39490 [Potentilla anserina]